MHMRKPLNELRMTASAKGEARAAAGVATREVY